QFADEIESENKELIRMIGELKREHEQRTGKLMERIEQLEQQKAESGIHAVQERADATSGTVLEPLAELVRQTTALPEVQDAEPEPETVSRFVSTVKARYQELFELYDEGKSIEY